MASRKDNKGRVLRTGECFNEKRSLYSYAYTDPMGKRRYIYARDLVTLREKETQLQRDQLDGLDSYVAGSQDLNFLFDRYFATKKGLRKSTAVNYDVCYDRYVRSDFGKKRIASIKYSDIIFFYNYLMEDKGLHIGTIKYIQRLLRPAFELAVKDNIIRNNPADGVIKHLNRNSDQFYTNTRHALTIEQQKAFLQILDDVPDYNKWKPFFTVMFGTGCRVGEVIGLRWEDIDLEKRTIDINHSLFYYAGSHNKSDNRWIVNKPKTDAGVRVIPMLDPVYEAFIEERERQFEEGTWCISEIDGMKDFIFCNRFRTICVPEMINRNIRRIIATHNTIEEVEAAREHREPVLLPHFSCHHIRHTFCARLCEADVNIKVIQALMGHKDIQTTLDIYAEVSSEKKKIALDEAVKKLNIF